MVAAAARRGCPECACAKKANSTLTCFFQLPAFGEALLRKLAEVNAGLARAWAGDLVVRPLSRVRRVVSPRLRQATMPADLARLTLNPLTLATLSPGATTYWIDTVEAVDALAAVLKQQREVGGQSLRKRGLPFSLVLGMDVESRPSFNGQRNRPSIIQVTTNTNTTQTPNT